MKRLGWIGKGLHLWAVRLVLAASLFTFSLQAAPASILQKSGGTEIGHGASEIGVGNSGIEVSLPNSVSNWTARASETYTELVAPQDSQSSTQTKLRISFKEVDQSYEDQLKELEEIGWRRFFWADMDGLRLERLWSKNRAVRALEVKLFRGAGEAIELILTGNKRSQSFSSVYEWLTPKREESEEQLSKNLWGRHLLQ